MSSTPSQTSAPNPEDQSKLQLELEHNIDDLLSSLASEDINPTVVLSNILKTGLSLLNVDYVIVYLYSQDEKRWLTPIAEGGYAENTSAALNQKSFALAQEILILGKKQWWASASSDPKLSGTFVELEGLRTVGALPLKTARESFGVMFVGYIHPYGFKMEESKQLDIFANEVMKAIDKARYFSRTFQVEYIHPDMLRVQMPLPSLLPVSAFTRVIGDTLEAVEYIYSAFAIIYSGNKRIIEALIHTTKGSGIERPTKSELFRLLQYVSIEPLLLISAKYGSNASFDFLGFGKILEIVKDTVKDLVWRGKHEKQMAEKDEKQKDIAIDAEKLEVERKRLELVFKKVELAERLSKSELPNDVKVSITTGIWAEMNEIANTPGALLLTEQKQSALLRDDEPKKINQP